MTGTWRPGIRRRPQSAKRTRLDDTVIALGHANNTQVIVKAEPPVPPDPNDPLYDGSAPEEGDEIVIIFAHVGSKGLALQLSQMTTKELDGVKQLIDFAFERARTVTSERDKIAAGAAANGDDSYLRRHRPGPSISIRPGKS